MVDLHSTWNTSARDEYWSSEDGARPKHKKDYLNQYQFVKSLERARMGEHRGNLRQKNCGQRNTKINTKNNQMNGKPWGNSQ